MESETMHLPGTNLARRLATNGARLDKDQPPPPPDKAQAAAAPRATTPTAPASRNQRSTQPKAPSRSATIDQSVPLAAATGAKQPAQPSAPPGLVPAPTSASASATTAPSGPAQRTPNVERDAFIQQTAMIDNLQAKIKDQEKLLQQKDAEIKYARGLVDHLKSKSDFLESQPYRNEVVSIRRHLQVDELCEPWEITKKFSEIIRKVEDISRDLGEALGSLPTTAKPTTLGFLKALSRTSEGQYLTAAEPSVELDIEDFIDFGCRALINEALFIDVLGPNVFHPGLNANDNHFYCDLYKQVRREEPQVVAGRWRISTLKVVSANNPTSLNDGILRLCQDTLLPFCSRVIEEKSCAEHIQKMIPRFQELFERANDWNMLTKTSFIMLDFHPQFQAPGTPHDPQSTTLEGRKPKPPSSKAILLTSKLGLWSSHADGGRKDPQFTLQTKATMLAAEYFA